MQILFGEKGIKSNFNLFFIHEYKIEDTVFTVRTRNCFRSGANIAKKKSLFVAYSCF
ncbi:hypothetical protein LEP1GSC086_4000 [Leptospira weilii str. LNT 1234]|nr:hypothetical protein LEP1GSC086_4000 [Leptospira weilii str. LNT 1234]